jgi:cytochrome d ubiquinol oxidase subunit II
MFVLLVALILRPVGFMFRNKIEDLRWRGTWDWALFVGGAVPALLFGVAFGNLLLGVPFSHDEFLRPSYSGSFWGLLHPFALLSGILSLAMLITHGALWLQLRTEAPIAARARAAARIAVLIMLAAFALAGIWLAFGIDGYRILSMPATDAPSNPLAKVVEIADGAWLNNYGRYPWMILAPVVAFAGGLGTFLLATICRPGWAFITNALSMAGVILTAACSMFPFILPSSTVPNSSLTVWDAPSSHLTLMVMFWAAAIFVPLILLYTFWSYRALWGKVTVKQIQENTHSAY